VYHLSVFQVSHQYHRNITYISTKMCSQQTPLDSMCNSSPHCASSAFVTPATLPAALIEGASLEVNFRKLCSIRTILHNTLSVQSLPVPRHLCRLLQPPFATRLHHFVNNRGEPKSDRASKGAVRRCIAYQKCWTLCL
jgi:hypothetical protein